MPSECPICHEVAVEAEPGGELVCHECGAMVESRVFSVGSDGDGLTFMSADGTAKFDGRHDLPRNVRSRLPSAKTTETKRALHSHLYSQVKRLNLSNEMFNKARELLFVRILPIRWLAEMKGMMFRRNVLVGSCLFIVCRQNNFQLTYRRMAEIAECNMFQLGNCVKRILKAFNIKLDPLSVDSFVACVLSEFSVFDISIEKVCLDLGQIFKHFGFSFSQNYTLKSISLVLLVLQAKKMSPTKLKIAEVLGKNSLTVEQLQRDLGRTKGSLLDLAKEVPWIPDSVKKSVISKHIFDIVNFHKKCGKLDLSVVKSLVMKKKENTEKNRKVKIQLAKSRILDKELGEPESWAISETNSSTLPVSQNCSSLREHQASGCHGNELSDEVAAIQSPAPQEILSPPSTNDDPSLEGSSSNPSDDLMSCTNDELDDNDILIEKLLQCGYSEEELMDGYFESRMCDVQSSQQLDPEGEREDLDELDIAEQEMHHYLWSVSEMERLRNLKTLASESKN